MDIMLIYLIIAIIVIAVFIFWAAFEDMDMERGIAGSVAVGFLWPMALVCLPFAIIWWLGHYLGKKNYERRSKENRP